MEVLFQERVLRWVRLQAAVGLKSLPIKQARLSTLAQISGTRPEARSA